MATVQGTYLKPDGSPSSGLVRFTLFPPATGLPPGELSQYTGSLVDVDLDRTGAFSVSLISDDALNVAGKAVYRVDEMIDGMSSEPWMLTVPYSDSVIDLPTVRGTAAGVSDGISGVGIPTIIQWV